MFAFTNPEEFYNLYQTKFWSHKATALMEAMRKKEQELLAESSSDLEGQQYLANLQMEIHFTYYQAVEALFTLVTAFHRRRINNKELWFYLAQLSKGNQQKKVRDTVSETAQGKTDYLDELVSLGSGIPMPLIQYLFYYDAQLGMSPGEVSMNFDNIKKLLVRMAVDFSNRSAYNAYKHGLRLYSQGESSLRLVNIEDPNEIHEFKMRPAIVILKTERDGTIAQVAEAFDYKRDFQMIEIASGLIHNIIESRRRFYSKDLQRLLYFVNGAADIDSVGMVRSDLLSWRLPSRSTLPED
jgi:hypothetical protein